jgi:hypothetical protein
MSLPPSSIPMKTRSWKRQAIKKECPDCRKFWSSLSQHWQQNENCSNLQDNSAIVCFFCLVSALMFLHFRPTNEWVCLLSHQVLVLMFLHIATTNQWVLLPSLIWKIIASKLISIVGSSGMPHTFTTIVSFSKVG